MIMSLGNAVAAVAWVALGLSMYSSGDSTAAYFALGVCAIHSWKEIEYAKLSRGK